MERLNEQLRKINFSLRQQARAGTIYAPGLTYVPPSLGSSSAYPVESMAVATPADVRDVSDVSDVETPTWESNVAVAEVEEVEEPFVVPGSYSAAAAEASVEQPSTSSIISTMSMDEEEQSAEARQCLQALKEGKRCA